MTRRLAAGCVDQTHGVTVAEQPGRNPHLAKEALQLGLGTRGPPRAAVVVGRLVERGIPWDRLDEHQRTAVAHAVDRHVGRSEGLVEVRQDRLQPVWERRPTRRPGDIVERPTQHGLEEGRQVGQDWLVRDRRRPGGTLDNEQELLL
ncbi:MAG: hypothetical protein OXH09_10790 [Gammaproteobacteria bacterium]|nr:hypothetical protein [Gammaproteobacteria bacterium]